MLANPGISALYHHPPSDESLAGRKGGGRSHRIRQRRNEAEIDGDSFQKWIPPGILFSLFRFLEVSLVGGGGGGEGFQELDECFRCDSRKYSNENRCNYGSFPGIEPPFTTTCQPLQKLIKHFQMQLERVKGQNLTG